MKTLIKRDCESLLVFLAVLSTDQVVFAIPSGE